MADGDALADIARSLALYRRGVFCPAELWEQVKGRIGSPDQAQLLEALPSDLRVILREAYLSRPHSLRSGRNDEAVCRTIAYWCEEGGA